MEEKVFWVGFNQVRGIGPVRLQSLLDHFGSLRTAWDSNPGDLHDAGLNQKTIENFLDIRQKLDLAQYFDTLLGKGIKVMTWLDTSYPLRLKNIPQPPPVLYLLGEYTEADQWAVAIVGTRRVTSYGRQVTEQTAAYLARQGITVVSGLARGVDGIAHFAALHNEGRTIAVLGSGVDEIYPPEHRQLAEKIAQNGAVVSDYAPGTIPDSC